MRNLIVLILICISGVTAGQSVITGTVYENGSVKKSLPGASIYWQDTAIATVADENGEFAIPSISFPAKLIASFAGFTSDTIEVNGVGKFDFVLRPSVELKEVQVTSRQDALSMSTIATINSEKVTQRELLKAACCNLSEAFETNPTVTVGYRDAITGAKEIQLLGLGGIYNQLLTENIPNMRGLAGSYGLSFIPGPWMESIQITKGAGSVLNGYESTTGQINVEFKKPDDNNIPRLYFNLFQDNFGSTEFNSFIKTKISENWSHMLMLHGRRMTLEKDRNDDGFMDIPGDKQVNLYSRWQYHSKNRLESQIGVKYINDNIEGGQMAEKGENRFLTKVKTNRFELFGKLGVIFPEKPMKSFGNIFQIVHHDMNSDFGLKSFDANQTTLYYQSIYQNVIAGRANHLIRTGFSLRYDKLNQRFSGLPSVVEETLAGVYAEYTYSYLDKFTAIAGLREDLRNGNELIFTPRLHLKYNFTENFILRASAGRSYRQPFIIADHLWVLVSSKDLLLKENINAEKAWNYGFNFTYKLIRNEKQTTLNFDLYRTDFINQLIVDTYSDTASISIYNLNGKSFSNSMQITLDRQVTKNIDVRVSYKTDDVQSTFNGQLERQPLIARNRFLGTISWQTDNKHWSIAYTYVLEGRKKLQASYSDATNREDYSPTFSLMNFQITKEFRKFDLYAGSENLLDFRQPNPIINAENPFGNNFDATNVWGPIAGRRIYAGIRMSIE